MLSDGALAQIYNAKALTSRVELSPNTGDALASRPRTFANASMHMRVGEGHETAARRR